MLSLKKCSIVIFRGRHLLYFRDENFERGTQCYELTWRVNIGDTRSHRSMHIARVVWQASKRVTWLTCSICSKGEQVEHKSMLDMLEGRARWAWGYARYARGSSKSSMRESRCVYKFSTRSLERVVFNSFQLFRYCFHCWSIRDIILTLVRLSLTNLSTRTNSSHLDTLEEGDLTQF